MTLVACQALIANNKILFLDDYPAWMKMMMMVIISTDKIKHSHTHKWGNQIIIIIIIIAAGLVQKCSIWQ